MQVPEYFLINLWLSNYGNFIGNSFSLKGCVRNSKNYFVQIVQGLDCLPTSIIKINERSGGPKG